jgi:hypothetical protein
MKRSGFKIKPRKPMKRGKLKKKSPQKVSILKRHLWEQFAKYIKNRDANVCFTCGRKAEGSGIHCGHFIPKSVGGIALYFHEDNCHAQCYNCNINLGGNQYIYGQKLGEQKVKELYAIKQQTNKWSNEDYLSKTEYYTKLNNQND